MTKKVETVLCDNPIVINPGISLPTLEKGLNNGFQGLLSETLTEHPDYSIKTPCFKYDVTTNALIHGLHFFDHAGTIPKTVHYRWVFISAKLGVDSSPIWGILVNNRIELENKSQKSGKYLLTLTMRMPFLFKGKNLYLLQLERRED